MKYADCIVRQYIVVRDILRRKKESYTCSLYNVQIGTPSETCLFSRANKSIGLYIPIPSNRCRVYLVRGAFCIRALCARTTKTLISYFDLSPTADVPQRYYSVFRFVFLLDSFSSPHTQLATTVKEEFAVCPVIFVR